MRCYFKKTSTGTPIGIISSNKLSIKNFTPADEASIEKPFLLVFASKS